MEKFYIIVFILFCCGALASLNIYLGKLAQKFNQATIGDEFDYMLHRLERYTTVSIGDNTTFATNQIKKQFNIQVNFCYYIVGTNMLYLFDHDKKLFAICDKDNSKTCLFNILQADDVFKTYEKQFCKTSLKPGDIVTLPFAYFQRY